MAIPIIGQSSLTASTEKFELPTPEVSLPAPSSVPAVRAVHSNEQLIALLANQSPMVRTFAIQRIEQLDEPAMIERVVALIKDADPMVMAEAIRLVTLNAPKAPELLSLAIESLADRFLNVGGEISARAASGLARLAPERLLEELNKGRGRLSDEAYAFAVAELARTESAPVIEFLGKSLNRAGALQVDRRSALYAAALLSGSSELSERVIGYAIADSKIEEPDYGTSPARAALASLGGLPLELATQAAGEQLLKSVHEAVGNALRFFESDPERQKDLDDAIRKNRPAEAIGLLEPILARPLSDALPELAVAPVRRRRSLLAAIVKQKEALRPLTPKACAIFLSTALEAAELLGEASLSPAEQPALKHLGASLSIAPEELRKKDLAALTADFEKRTEREMRRVLNILSHEPLQEQSFLERMVEALFAAGHGVALIDATSEGNIEGLAVSVLRAGKKRTEKIEAAVLEVLERRPLVPGPASVAMGVAAHLATERVALAIGKRFFALREVARAQLNEALIRIGDPRLLPLIESRAYADEPEEVAVLLLAEIAGLPLEGRRAEMKARLDRDEGSAAQQAPIEVELRCKRCAESLNYRFPAIFIDPTPKAKDGDPAYVGDPICKACGAEDLLEPTDSAVRVITSMMMRYLSSVEQGRFDELRVLPQTTRVTGKETGLAEALRILDEEVARAPDSIRMRLRRARIRSLLRRKRAAEDVDAVLKLDARSPEALTVLAQVKLSGGDRQGAVDSLVAAREVLEAENEPRLYELEKPTLMREVENALIRLEEAGAKLPSTVDLREARRRVAAENEARMAAEEEAMERMQAARSRAPR